MAKVIKEDLGWYKITTGRNFEEKAARHFIAHNMNRKKVLRSLIAQHNPVEVAKEIIDKIIDATTKKYNILACHGYILVKA